MTSKNNPKRTKKPVLSLQKSVGSLSLYTLSTNGLQVLFLHMPKTGIITSNIMYKVGSRDENRGETGIAHMLEHMLFKPTKHDIDAGIDSSAMQFERETGITLNANTWKDRTCYYFSYPKHHFSRALRIEAERMRDMVLTDAEFLPERANVLSEYDMYAGDEDFALSVGIVGTALHTHPYGHETIGYREDIESYTCEKLTQFYNTYYVPNNATLIIVGDVSESTMKHVVIEHFAHLTSSTKTISRLSIHEPKQEGVRTVSIKRNSTKNILSLAFRHDGFPHISWFETMTALTILAGEEDSILHKKLVDTGLASAVSTMLEPTYDTNVGMLTVHLTKKTNHKKIYAKIRKILDTLTIADIQPHLKKVIARSITAEYITRSSSLGIAQELVEYMSADAWEHFYETEDILRHITAKEILTRIQTLFAEDVLTIGSFIGTNIPTK
ncbi:MAG TPA: pitrilysin family protein [Candidatus Paceibacterota bacterium]|nr:pitrilysin family protein [Candidatus Paceibacterota bacterium]